MKIKLNVTLICDEYDCPEDAKICIDRFLRNYGEDRGIIAHEIDPHTEILEL